jgi:hypothetical protein
LAVEGCVGITVWDFYDPVSSSSAFMEVMS